MESYSAEWLQGLRILLIAIIIILLQEWCLHESTAEDSSRDLQSIAYINCTGNAIYSMETANNRLQTLVGTESGLDRNNGIADGTFLFDKSAGDRNIITNSKYINGMFLDQKYECLQNMIEEELETLYRIVEAEAGGEDKDGKILVANVVMNRVLSEEFPDTISEVVFQNNHGKYQFSPAGSGRIYNVEVSEDTKEAVCEALSREDLSEGALYFASRRYANKNNMKWFDECLTYLFAHGGHEFFR